VDPGPIRDALTFLVGIGAGVLSAAFGVGGAVVTTPAVRALGLSAELAIGTTLPSILPSALAGAYHYSREGLVDWRIARFTVPAGMVASIGGSVLAHKLPGEGHWLMIATALLLAFTAVRMARPAAPPRSTTSEPDPDLVPGKGVPGSGTARGQEGGQARSQEGGRRMVVFVLVGALAGVLSGLLGIGGGTVLVPGFTELGKVPLKTAIATSLVCVGLFAVPGTITHYLLHGIVWWPWAVLLAVGVVPGARLGARLAMRTTDVRLRAAVAIFLGAVAVLYLIGEIGALASGRS
jgi:uncharacterized membrane protein YfcA